MSKINIEDYLHSIDIAFSQKTQKDIYMIYIIIIAAIFAFSYSLFWDSSVEEFESTRASVVQLNNKITHDERFLQTNPESKITKLNTEIIRISEDVIKSKDANAYIKSKIETISSLIYDERTWGEYLDSIAKNAQHYNMKIKTFTNTYAAKGKHFGHILDITISASGHYKNTLRFINSLERSDLVVDIHGLSIKAQRKLNSDLNISVWGITY